MEGPSSQEQNPSAERLMPPGDVGEIVEQLAGDGVKSWLEGGWGVDALLGEQTRPHQDLDLVIALDRAGTAQETLERLGYRIVSDELPTKFMMADDRGHEVDFHTVTFDQEGGGLQRLQDGRTYRYAPEGFKARGHVAGAEVHCLSAEVQASTHYGYEPAETDLHDMRLLADRFGLKLRPPYDR